MTTSYKTPGVYVEEIVKFPPSVAQVETAIPAFIGYTEKATNKIKGDLKGIPTRITSLLEYETYFGAAKPETTLSVTINDTLVDGTTERSIIVDQPTSKEPFLMYYSLQMYFANGGGPCYIVSVGRYGDGLDKDDTAVTAVDFNALKTGLDTLEKYDEPTLILFPDATSLSSVDDFYNLYNLALAQCNKLQDRFTIIDTKGYDTDSTGTFVSNLRLKISSDKDKAKYGAVYYPFIQTILDYIYDESKIELVHKVSTDSVVSKIITNLNNEITSVQADRDDIETQIINLTSLPLADGSVSDSSLPTYPDNVRDSAEAIVVAIYNSLSSVTSSNDIIVTEVQKAANAVADEDSSLQSELETLINGVTGSGNYDGLKKFFASGAIKNVIEYTDSTRGTNANYNITVADYSDANAYASAINTKVANFITYINTTNQLLDSGSNGLLDDYLDFLLDATSTGLSAKLIEAGSTDDGGIYDGLMLNTIKSQDNSTYNKILTEIKNLPMELPPSSTIAGVYASVDSSRGVWKAPANVSLNYVIKPSVIITHEMQEGLNVDTEAGKSINAIRAFTGKGTLVWGARTLAGNDNEWRYVPVRRFFNMVEESVKKATSQFVFEPNDANTWIKVRAMIENFLTLQWRAGALAGAKQEQAFYVRVGLGQTMTAEDILNGYMHVEIGMAVVRPAEFIVLKFSHKLQEA
jgi:uncharacterized protein